MAKKSPDDVLKYVPGMPWKLEDGVRVPDMDAIRSCPFPTPYTVSQLGARPKLRCTPESSRTQQEFADECDINVIMRRYGRTGQLPNLNLQGVYGDFAEIPDYMEALNTVLKAQADFAELPATVRERFQHNPGAMLQFLSDPKNREEAIKIGLIDNPVNPPDSPPGQNKTNNDSNDSKK